MARVKVLWVAKGLGAGGMERLLLELARVADLDSFDYTVASVVDVEHDLIAQLTAQGLDHVRLGSGSALNPRWLADLRRLVRRRRIDVVHIHSPMIAALARPVLRSAIRRPGVMYTEHNTRDAYRFAARWANLATYALDDVRVAVSPQAASSPPRWLRRRTEVVIHGLDLDEVRNQAARCAARAEFGVGPESLVVGVVANHRREKGYEVLFDAARSLSTAHPDVVFISLGFGPLLDAHRRMCARPDLAPTFKIQGFRADARRLMSGFDLLAFGSLQEGLPVAAMEAKALGLPVVAPAVGGLVDAVRPGEGVLVPQGDSEALARAIAGLADHPDRRSELAEGSRISAGRYDIRRAARRIEQLYAELAEGTRR